MKLGSCESVRQVPNRTRRHYAYAFCLQVFLAGAFDWTMVSQGQDALVPLSGATPQAPPPAPPIELRTTPPAAPQPRPFGLTPYLIGQPTDEEQLYLEYLNRMRANPAAEGQRLAATTDPNVLSAYSYFSVDLGLMQSEFSTNPAVPPLAMNAKLIATARWHSGDMFTNQYQGHFQTNGAIVMSPGDRMLTNGYNWTAYGENVYSYADSVFYGHAGFAVDWGPGPGGMQPDLGHRANMLSTLFREVGVGVVDGVNGSVGPQLVTQDFGTAASGPPVAFITGVVYYDFANTGFYAAGEGIGGVTVNTPGSSYYAMTSDSGGYAIPITSNGTYTITFSASGLNTQRVVTVSALNNVKLDFVPVYSPPVISGPNPAYLNQSNNYTFSVVGGATAYQWEQTQLVPYTYVEGAENGLADVSAMTSPGYAVVENNWVDKGNYSFQLAHISDPTNPKDQVLTLNASLLVTANSQLSFDKFLGYTFSNEVAHAQVSADGGATWQDLWTQAGNDGSSSVDSSYINITRSLAGFAGQVLQVRFVFSYSSGFYYSPGYQVGLYLDNISISTSSELTNQFISPVSNGTSFAFDPTNSGSYLLQVRPQINSRVLSWGPGCTVGTTSAPPSLQLVSKPNISAGQVQVDFTANNYRAGMTFQLWKAGSPTGTWTQDTSATLTVLVPNSKFRFATAQGTATKMFYKVKASY